MKFMGPKGFEAFAAQGREQRIFLGEKRGSELLSIRKFFSSNPMRPGRKLEVKEKARFWYAKSRDFIKEVWTEANPEGGKVSWPTKKAIIGSTIAVLIAVVIFSLYLAIVDYISLTIMMFLIR